MSKFILAINPGSTSTKVGLFEGETLYKEFNISHPSEELQKFKKITDQYDLRSRSIEEWLTKENVKLTDLVAVVGRGGLLHPMPSGVYRVSDIMIEDLKIGVQGEHASNLGGMIARALADKVSIESFIVDPVAVDEFHDLSRISGLPQIKRKSLGHALNIKAVSYRLARSLNRELSDLNLIVVHLGGGISVAPLLKGKMIDVNNANEMGPFSPERSGGLPSGDVARLAFSGEYTFDELKNKLRGKGGVVAYLGTNDMREVRARMKEGDQKAKLIFEAMAYQVSKEIGAMATVLSGEVDRIVLTGGIAHSNELTDLIKEHVLFIAPVEVYPGEDELQALAEGANRAINGVLIPKIYEEEVQR